MSPERSKVDQSSQIDDVVGKFFSRKISAGSIEQRYQGLATSFDDVIVELSDNVDDYDMPIYRAYPLMDRAEQFFRNKAIGLLGIG